MATDLIEGGFSSVALLFHVDFRDWESLCTIMAATDKTSWMCMLTQVALLVRSFMPLHSGALVNMSIGCCLYCFSLSLAIIYKAIYLQGPLIVPLKTLTIKPRCGLLLSFEHIAMKPMRTVHLA
uniref:Uncharacterized protein n=1 Tax=Parascaris univalens TaxID=6257 RepID=A0A915A6E5_PARUN